MKKNFYSTFILVLVASQIFAQCGARYKDMIFSAVTKTSDVIYSTANGVTRKLDVYQPTGDTASMRPLLIMAHGGSFLSGNKSNDGVCTQMCTNFAKRGYVCASIDYRLAQFPWDMLDSSKAITTVMKAISDGKSVIRFFRKDAATTNTYKIDPNKIFAGGNSAGAVLYIHCAYIDSLNEAPVALRSIITQNGGIEGNSGNDGYSSEMTAVVSLAGGLNVPEFVGPGNKPSFNAQGDADLVVPYGCANAQNNSTPVRLCGLGVLEPLYVQYNINHYSIVYPGEGHTPWASNTSEMTQIDTACANFLYPYACNGTISSVNDLKGIAEISLFPNPASSEINIRSSAKVSIVSMYDNIGQIVTQSIFENTNGKINTSTFAKGVYHVKVEFADKNIAIVVRKVVIE